MALFTKIKSLAVAIAFCIVYGNAMSATYFVSPLGSDANNGTSPESAFKTINYAVNFPALTAGDTILIKGGTYKERVVMTKSGSPDDRIIVKNFTSEVPVVDGTGLTWTAPYHNGLVEVQGSYVTIDGLKIINANGAVTATGILVCDRVNGIRHVTIRNCNILNSKSSGIAVWGSKTAYEDYTGASNIIFENDTIVGAISGGNQEIITVAEGVDTFEVRNCYIHDAKIQINTATHTSGICAKSNVRNGKIYGNEVFNLVQCNAILVTAYGHVYNIDIFGNKTYNVDEDGINAGCGADSRIDNIRIFNNVIYNVKWNGLKVGAYYSHADSARNIYLFNNTVVGCDQASVMIEGHRTGQIVVKNNIFTDNLWNNGVYTYTVNNPNVTIDHNLISQNMFRAWSDPKGKEEMGTNVITGKDPLFVNASLKNYRLLVGSPAIDAGDSSLMSETDFDGKIRLVGSNPDMGAFEYEFNPNSVTGISLATSEAALPVYDSVLLEATVQPVTAINKKVVWKSSDPRIATVDDAGMVTAKASGITVISATTAEDGYVAKCNVKVSDKSAANLLLNPGFESDLSIGWTVDRNNSQLNTTVSNSGIQSIQVGPGEGGRTQVITSGFTVGESYVLTAFCKLSETGAPAGATIGVVCKDATGTILVDGEFTSTDITADTFELKTVPFKVPENTSSIEVYIWYPGGSPIVFADDFVLTKGVPVSEIELSPISASISLNQKLQLVSTVLPVNAYATNVNWESSDTAILEVNDQGVVTGILPGTATVTCSSADGSIKASSAIIVNNNMIINPGFEDDLSLGWDISWHNSTLRNTQYRKSGTFSLQVGISSGGRAQSIASGIIPGETYRLTVYAMNNGAWTYDDYVCASISVICFNKKKPNAKLAEFKTVPVAKTMTSFTKVTKEFKMPATTDSLVIKFYTNGGAQAPTYYLDNFELIHVPVITSLQHAEIVSPDLEIFPNPASNGIFTIRTNNIEGEKTISIFDVSGKKVYGSSINRSGNEIQVNIPGLNGLYIVKVSTSTKNVTKKVILQ